MSLSEVNFKIFVVGKNSFAECVLDDRPIFFGADQHVLFCWVVHAWTQFDCRHPFFFILCVYVPKFIQDGEVQCLLFCGYLILYWRLNWGGIYLREITKKSFEFKIGIGLFYFFIHFLFLFHPLRRNIVHTFAEPFIIRNTLRSDRSPSRQVGSKRAD